MAVSYYSFIIPLTFDHSSFKGYESKSAKNVLACLNETSLDSGNALSSAPGGTSFGIHFRTLGDVAYFMTSLNTPSTTIRIVEERILKTLQSQPDGYHSLTTQ